MVSPRTVTWIGGCIAMVASVSVAAAEWNANPIRGKELYESRCIGCHSIDANRTGPAHRGVFGRRAGTAPGYQYSSALKESDVVWTRENLDRWLTNPESVIPGQRMGYSVPDAQDRRDLIAYLKSISQSPPN